MIPVVAAIIVRSPRDCDIRQEEVLIGRYSAWHTLPYLRGAYTTPGGKIEQITGGHEHRAEFPHEAAMREVGQECGTVDGLTVVAYTYSSLVWIGGHCDGNVFASWAVFMRATSAFLPRTVEDKVGGWQWCSRAKLPGTLDITPVTLRALATFGWAL